MDIKENILNILKERGECSELFLFIEALDLEEEYEKFLDVIGELVDDEIVEQEGDFLPQNNYSLKE